MTFSIDNGGYRELTSIADSPTLPITQLTLHKPMSALAHLDAQIREIDVRIAALRAQAAQIRSGERTKVIEEVRAKMEEYGITTADLAIKATRRQRTISNRTRLTSVRSQRVVKYRSPAGETWSGGPGRKPKWVAEVLAQGKSIEEFAV